LTNPLFHSPAILQFIQECLAEDIGSGDHSANACIPASAQGQSRMLIKEQGIIAGLELAEVVFHQVDPNLKVTHLLQDGTPVQPGDVALLVTGSARNILTAERLVLNLCQRLSGVATSTNRYVQELAGLTHQSARHPQNHTRHALAGEMGRKNRRRRKPPHWFVRHDYD
jgi:nicotinate-nucleotide pyrophosphorylase (carboxylating)